VVGQNPFDLQRFVDAQAPIYEQVVAELRAGRKRTHWMWFVFPQIAGLGHSAMAQRYAIASLAEAKAYLAHPVLGQRLRNCTALVNAVPGRAIGEIFGHPDDLKFHSSMTLFARAAADERSSRNWLFGDGVFEAALKKYFGGKADDLTLARVTH
jgi:uncharacterized protein (DUF1810 family)